MARFISFLKNSAPWISTEECMNKFIQKRKAKTTIETSKWIDKMECKTLKKNGTIPYSSEVNIKIKMEGFIAAYLKSLGL